MTENNENLKYTDKLEISVPKIGAIFGITEKDWKKLRNSVINLSDDFKWLELLLSVAVSSLASFAIAFWATPKDSSGRDALINAMLITGTTSIITAIFMFARKQENAYSKKAILQEMDDIHCISSEETTGILMADEKKSKQRELMVIDEWKTSKSMLPQGACFKKLELEGQYISTLSFKLSSDFEYWRAGVKFASANSDADTHILTDKSFLFHLSKNNSKSFLVEIYPNGSVEKAKHQVFENKNGAILSITIERSDRNLINCYVNDVLIHSVRIKLDYLKNTYLCAWGDENDYSLTFKGIKYSKDVT
ncbi:MAG: hypothetical protein US57_C0002G0003 [Candidatus Moranbacteria bacterium GW2011_GWC2_37_73]|nr:MAG: hypothetical protein UR95_C0002G0101 [Parcubacteria group bacterium GW2011_GWC1_36_108]KKQ01056.1 MAG: hypothetical protein US09_C0003G0056 [Candidatus Moranbacteria bacterium GW2011_GWD1_36_198]KKQ02458.1 MAG: hypothetical protein US10_C0001G0056 [Candidatus Moranbacteria bacterium GW2011_GWD2_36_198]KKQ40296.1 MAG: hypothetical protein US57_C0002G0003 [Candidatus Moranbacteria bacterium GW2011_GWC2_37_73]HAS00263.1 hypothetical protein [Candidatus Moranbacteria bacterium]